MSRLVPLPLPVRAVAGLRLVDTLHLLPMVRTGEERGTLPEMLMRRADNEGEDLALAPGRTAAWRCGWHPNCWHPCSRASFATLPAGAPVRALALRHVLRFPCHNRDMRPLHIYQLPLILLLPLLLLGGCAETPAPQPVPPARQAPAAPESGGMEAWYRKAAHAGQAVYRIAPDQSLITVTVRRGGALARLGHDHVIASRSVEGFVAPDAGRADFHFRLDAMSVDEPELRSAAGLATQPSADAVEGTRTNMLNRVLEAERFPVVMLHAERAPGGGDVLRLGVTLHGVTRTVDVPTRIERSKAALAASGELRLLQSDFGITPMSVMGGAMTVQDQMELKFRIVAVAPR